MYVFIAAFLLSWLYHGLGVTLGYHRLLSHRSFKTPRWLEYLFVSGAYLCFEGSPIFWVSVHRMHHRYSDQPGDPHSPLDGVWHAFMGWLFKPTVEISPEQKKLICPDLYRDRVYSALQIEPEGLDGVMCLTACLLFRLIIFFVFGPIALLGNLAGTVLGFFGPHLVNTLCHLPSMGYQTYDAGDRSRNVGLVAMLSFGEGWHNNHHAFPQSARHGLKPTEVDLSWITLVLLSKIGLVTDVRLPQRQSQPASSAKFRDSVYCNSGAAADGSHKD